MPRHSGLLPALAVGLSFALVGPGFAQTTLTLPPPATAPAAVGTPATKAPTKKAHQPRKRTAKPASDDGLGLPGVSRESAAAKPRRFVPEEFDNGDESGSPRPFMSETGRPGLGMKF